MQPEQDKPDFVRNVWKVVGGIPKGHVLTYGEVARLAGRPNGARHVSQAMRLAPRKIVSSMPRA
jgi:methylated-DNA-protein-cysteine methyltransferase-like protein